jgi:hypothetical protein
MILRESAERRERGYQARGRVERDPFNILLQPLAMPREGQLNWAPESLPNGKVQYVDPNHVYMMLPGDLALLEDPATAAWVEAYARNAPLFFRDFAAA